MIWLFFVISKEDKDSLIVDLNNNDCLIVNFHKQDQDSRIVELHNNDSLGVALHPLIVDLHNQDEDSRIIAVHNKDSLCMYMFTYVGLMWIHKAMIKHCDSCHFCKSSNKTL